MLGEAHFDSSLEMLAPLGDEWRDSLVPDTMAIVADAPYSSAYAWMYAYERLARRRLAKALGRPLGGWERRLFGPGGVFSEAASNAFVHGHRRNGGLEIAVRWAVSRKGMAFSIANQGPGFDAKDVLRAFNRRAVYYHVAGNGLRAFVQAPDVVVAFSDCGRELHARVRFDYTT